MHRNSPERKKRLPPKPKRVAEWCSGGQNLTGDPDASFENARRAQNLEKFIRSKSPQRGRTALEGDPEIRRVQEKKIRCVVCARRLSVRAVYYDASGSFVGFVVPAHKTK